MNQCYRHVRPVRDGYLPVRARVYGVTRCTIGVLETLFGRPHDATGSCTYSFAYYFATPRGLAILRDHWQDPENEYRLLSDDSRAVRWLASYLTKHGAHSRVIAQTRVES